MGLLQDLVKDMNVPSFSFKALNTGEQLTLTVFNGRVRLTVWPSDKSNVKGPVFAQNLTPAGFEMFKDIINGYQQVTPGSRKVLLFTEWDPENRKPIPKASFVFGQDDKQTFYFEVQFKYNDNNKIIQFPILAGMGIQNSATEFTTFNRSVAQIKAIKNWNDSIVPIASVITSVKMAFNSNKQNTDGDVF